MFLDVRKRVRSVIGTCFVLAVLSLTGFLAQDTVTPPEVPASPSPLPSATPTPLPRSSPSPTPLPGARNFHQWGSITVFNGLPSDSVRAIAQTPDGVMWFGTDNGIARFDGRRIQNLFPGTSDASRILVMKAAATGELWIGTRAGAFVYADDHFQPIEGVEANAVTAIRLGTQVILGTDTGLLFRVDRPDSGRPLARPLLTGPPRDEEGAEASITSITEQNGRIVVGTHGAGVFLLGETGLEQLRTQPRPLFVNSLAPTEEGALVLGTDAARGISGVYAETTGTRFQRLPVPTSKVLVLESNDSGLWAGTERFGLFQIEGSRLKRTYTFENTSGGLRSNTVFTIFTDREGVIWIGTNRGVSRFDRAGAVQQTVSDVPNSNFIRTLTREGPVFAGSNRGLFRMEEPKTGSAEYDGPGRWTEVPSFKNRVIYAVRQRSRSTTVVGTPEGMFDISGRKLTSGDYRGFATFAGKDHAAVFGRGVVDISGSDVRGVFDERSVTSVFGTAEKLWIGTAGNGLYSFDGRSVTKEAGPEILKSGNIWNMYQAAAADSPLLIAGEHGVFAFNSRGKVEQIAAAEDVRDVIEHDGQVWAATTTQGLLHARRDDRFGWIVSAVGFEQGLPSEKAFSIRSMGTGLMIATNRGVVTYQTGAIAPKLIATRVLSQRVHDLRELRSTIPLEFPQDAILVEVAGLSSRTFPEEFQYSYTLKNGAGSVLETSLSSEPQYSRSGLKPGDYVIEATAFDRDLLESQPLAVRFSVADAPFPWTATALGALLAVAVVALVWAMVERGRIIRQARELAAARLDLAHEAERERSRIARDLHDQTLADLRDLILKSDKAMPHDSGFRDDIESISTEIRRICEDLSPSVLENVGLAASLEFLLSRSVDDYSFNAEGFHDEDLHFPLKVQLQIYRICQEVLTNIKKHARAHSVEMELKNGRANGLTIRIVNDGVPFEPVEETPTGGRGVAGIRTRASMINAVARWGHDDRDRPSFILTLPGPGETT